LQSMFSLRSDVCVATGVGGARALVERGALIGGSTARGPPCGGAAVSGRELRTMRMRAAQMASTSGAAKIKTCPGEPVDEALLMLLNTRLKSCGWINIPAPLRRAQGA
jgi:hypothetical protein